MFARTGGGCADVAVLSRESVIRSGEREARALRAVRGIGDADQRSGAGAVHAACGRGRAVVGAWTDGRRWVGWTRDDVVGVCIGWVWEAGAGDGGAVGLHRGVLGGAEGGELAGQAVDLSCVSMSCNKIGEVVMTYNSLLLSLHL